MPLLMNASQTKRISSARAVGMTHRWWPYFWDCLQSFDAASAIPPRGRKKKPGNENSEILRSFHDLWTLHVNRETRKKQNKTKQPNNSQPNASEATRSWGCMGVMRALKRSEPICHSSHQYQIGRTPLWDLSSALPRGQACPKQHFLYVPAGWDSRKECQLLSLSTSTSLRDCTSIVFLCFLARWDPELPTMTIFTIFQS